MNKQDFERVSGCTVSIEDFKTIEYVYMWHPAIPDAGGKEKIAAVYNAGGIGVIRSMFDIAKKGEENYKAIREKGAQLARLIGQSEKLKGEIEELKKQLEQYQ